MNISQSWLNEHIQTELSAGQFSDLFNMLGIEVESYSDSGAVFKGFVTAKVLTKEPLPTSKKPISLCTVSDGDNVYNVVCGASNVDAGQIIVLATEGAIVPNGGFEIARRKVYGVESQGMICSTAELNLTEEYGSNDGIWVLPDNTPIGVPLSTYLDKNDTIYEISITPNRADVLSHRGIARVLSAIESKDLITYQPNVVESERELDLTIDIRSADHCPRYTARIIRGVKIAESPLWLKKRLQAIGIRPKNNVVDITNYVMLDCGQPLHAFDASYIKGNTIVVRTANDGEVYTTLDGKERTLDSDMLMICDEEKSLAIGGVMGGLNSAITDDSTTILLESAVFTPSSIRRTAKKLGISSDASYRFERGVDMGAVHYALERATELICQLAGGSADKGIAESGTSSIEQKSINLRFNQTIRIIGVEISADIQCSTLERLGFVITERTDEHAILLVPSYRVDIHQEIDCIEEIAILLNYDSLPLITSAEVSFGENTLPSDLLAPSARNKFRNYLAGRGFNEIITQNQTDVYSTSLSGQTPVQLANPLGEELSYMRTSLLPSMLTIIRGNVNNGNKSLRLFEVGKIFSVNSKESESPINESEYLCIAITGNASNKGWNTSERVTDFYDMKGEISAFAQHIGVDIVFHPSGETPFTTANTVAVSLGNQQVGFLGEVRKDILKKWDIGQPIFIAELNTKLLYSASFKQRKYTPVSAYPIMQRDLAFIVDKQVQADSIKGIIKATGSELLKSVSVFDYYDGTNLGEGKKSLAFSLEFGSSLRTLTDSETDNEVKTIIQAVTKSLNATLRG
jgi:phenylalanyl-tRNA synthetase beta chain